MNKNIPYDTAVDELKKIHIVGYGGFRRTEANR